eukprot:s1062_g13.t1
MTYKNMHIIPVALLQDNCKLTCTCRWPFLARSGEFQDWFDGPEKAPHIRVTIDKETLSTYVGEKEFTLKVDTSRVGSKATITKPDSAMELPDGTGYMTTARIPSVEADNFRLALSWRANCVDEAWKRVAADLPVNTNDTKQMEDTDGVVWISVTSRPSRLQKYLWEVQTRQFLCGLGVKARTVLSLVSRVSPLELARRSKMLKKSLWSARHGLKGKSRPVELLRFRLCAILQAACFEMAMMTVTFR